MTQQDLLAQLAKADELRPGVIAARQCYRGALKSYSNAGASEMGSQRSLQEAITRLTGLESGRGAQLARIGQATLYEFWIDLPGYSGPVRGATARVTQHGDIQHVSDVKGQTKGGLGGAVVGGVLFNAPGAVVGAIVRRKTTVKTDIRQVDTRQFELEVTGPGFAWSTIHYPNTAAHLQQFRDLTNARGSSPDNLEALVQAQAAYVEMLRANSQDAAVACQSALAVIEDSKAAYDSAWGEYAAARLPLGHEIRVRWEQSNMLRRITVVGLVPALIVAWIAWLAVGLAMGDPGAISLAVQGAVLYLIAVSVVATLYIHRVRLLKQR